MEIIHKLSLNNTKIEEYNDYFDQLIQSILLKFKTLDYEQKKKRFIIK